MKTFTKTFLTGIALCSITIITNAQSWNLAGNAGTTTSNFLGTTDTKDLIFKVNNAERGRLLNTPGAWRFGNATNFAKIDSAGKLTFGGTAAYLVGGNKYAFQYAAAPNYGLFFNSTNVRYEFRNGLATPIFYVDANNGNGVFAGSLKVGTYILPAFDGVAGQVLKTDGTGILSWHDDNNPIYTAGTGIDVSGEIITNTAPDQQVILNNGTGINITGSYPNFTVASTVTASQWTTSGGNIYFSAGNVGVGTTTPSAKLEVTGGDALINGITVGSGGGFLASNAVAGRAALASNTTGYANTANGDSALYSNTTGKSNVAIGAGALRSNTIKGNLIAIGDSSLYANTTGILNTAIGSKSLLSNTSGGYNTATGASALGKNVSGSNNTANGLFSLALNTVGNNNSAYGSNTMENNISGSENNAFGLGSLRMNTTGKKNIAIGNYALYNNVAGSDNIAIGDSALFNNQVNHNTAVGNRSLTRNTSGDYNTALGYMALYSNTTGTISTALGYTALYSNTTGASNTALGLGALYDNTAGSYNTATGKNAMRNNITGDGNTANGDDALEKNTTGNNNISIGASTLVSNTVGIENSASGFSALSSNTTGNYNTANGADALDKNVTGSGNTGLGKLADVSSGGLANATALGYLSYVDASNKVRIGNSSVSSNGGQVSWSTYSDERIKDNIQENIPGLKFIKELRPVSFHYNVAKENRLLGITDTAKWEGKYDIEKINFTGFLAQQVDAAAKRIGYDFSGVDRTGNVLSLRYSDFVVPIVKGMQELSKQEDDKDEAIALLQKENNVMTKTMHSQQQQIDELKAVLLNLQQNFSNCNPCSQQSITSNESQTSNAKQSSASLEQNIPNPFNSTTTINYTLPEKYSSAKIIVVDKTGKVLKETNLYNSSHSGGGREGGGKGSLQIDASTLASGAYNYTLYIDGKLIDTRQMILTK